MNLQNLHLIQEFEKLVKQIKMEYLSAQMDNNTKEMTMHQYRLQNIKKVLSTLKKIPFEITDSSQVKNIPGFGKGTLRRIEEILKTGKLSEIQPSKPTSTSKLSKADKADKAGKKIAEQIQALTEVIGIGPKSAEKLVRVHGIHTVPELKKAIAEGKIQLPRDVVLGVKYWGKFQRDIPRKEVALIEKYLKLVVHKLNPNFDIMICGSYRRGKSTSGDIDVLLYSPTVKTLNQINRPSFLEKFVDELTIEGFVLDNLTYENFTTKYMGFSQLKNNPVRRIDIRFVPYESFYTAMLYFTGPGELNEEMRRQAKKHSMKLSEYGLYKVNLDGTHTPLKIKSEEDVFKYLGMKYLTPTERESYTIIYKK